MNMRLKLGVVLCLALISVALAAGAEGRLRAGFTGPKVLRLSGTSGRDNVQIEVIRGAGGALFYAIHDNGGVVDRPPNCFRLDASEIHCPLTEVRRFEILLFSAHDDLEFDVNAASAVADASVTAIGGGGFDIIGGFVNDDRLSGGDRDDELAGGRGADLLAGGEGDDELTGGPGDDRLLGGPGLDHLIGGGGNDRCVQDPGDQARPC
jgi:Ca2+-binding RTX toxin-like protein